MSKSGKKTHKRPVAEYAVKSLCFLLIFLAVTIGTVFAAINPVTELVHKAEAYFGKEVRDVQLNDSAYAPRTAENADEVQYSYGDKAAVISSDDFGLNCAVYYGANRMSMENGAGLSASSGKIASDSTSVIVGYMERSFSSLVYAEPGDVLTVTTNYGSFDYSITDTQYIKNDEDDFNALGQDKLVLCALTSELSEHQGEKLCVIAERIGEGG